MIKLYAGGAYLVNQKHLIADTQDATLQMKQQYGVEEANKEELAKHTMAYQILKSHNTSGDMSKLKIKFDAMASHDITYVGIIQTARASGLKEFPLPYVLTNCHNSLCAVGGTINEDDHMFGLSAAKKYGGIYVPAHQAVIHQYMREMMAGCGKMILGSDSHTRYGALGTMAIGEGGGELAKQLLNRTYDINRPGVVAVHLTGKPNKGVGPQDVALTIIGAVFKNGYVKNKVMEFVGEGIKNLSVEYRNGIDVMTTETTCLSSIWMTDEKVEEYLDMHGRKHEYHKVQPGEVAYYDGAIEIDLAKVKPMIALPFHPSNTYTIDELNENLEEILAKVEVEAAEKFNNGKVKFTLRDKIKEGRLQVQQGVIAGCAGGTYDNICDAADILRGHTIGMDEYTLSIYPSSQPTFMSLVKNGAIADLMATGATVRTAFCGPCFGAGDVPPNNGLSIRHSTRNFPNREGSKPGDGQLSGVALMDARSIAATSVNGGRLTAATEIDANFTKPKYFFDKTIYEKRCYNGVGKADTQVELKFGPNITDWPSMSALTDDLLLKVVAEIHDDVTTTDELIPSGETSSYRSNPLRLAEFALSRRVPTYVGKAKEVQQAEKARISGEMPSKVLDEVKVALEQVKQIPGYEGLDELKVGVGSTIYANKPGDGSAREQAASCQKVLGGWANIAKEYATKRYRSNLINWGMVPFTIEEEIVFKEDDYIFIPGIRDAVKNKVSSIKAYVLGTTNKSFTLTLKDLTDDERDIILAGCLINYYKN